MKLKKILKISRNVTGHLILHSFILFACIWVPGLMIRLFFENQSEITLDLLPIESFRTWLVWLITNWGRLDIAAYDYIQIKLLLIMGGPLLLAIIFYIFNYSKLLNWEFFQPNRAVYGSSDWASAGDIEKIGLRNKTGLILGHDSQGYFVSSDFQHTLLFAPTGSGKGVGFVIPNMLFWEDSVIAHDVKLENHAYTSGWRKKQGHEVYVWDPANPDGITHCYNPLDWISDKLGQMVDDVQKIGNLLMPKQDFWVNEARSLFLGVVLYLKHDKSRPTSFGEVVRCLRNDDAVYNFAVILDTMGGEIHPVAYMNIAAFLQKADKERSGVISTLNSAIELWANPLIDAATARSDFSLMDLKKKKTTIYVGVTPDNVQRLQRLMQIFYQQATEFATRKVPDLKEEPYGILFLMDEFPTVGVMEQFKTGIAFFRGYRVRLFLVVQDTEQLKGLYKADGMNSFLSNSMYRITFAANNYDTATLISHLCGNKTVDNTSYSHSVFSLDFTKMNKTVSKVQRPLLLPQEVIQLPRDEQILLVESAAPVRSKKIRYFTDKFFTKRLLKPTPIPVQEAYDPRKN